MRLRDWDPPKWLVWYGCVWSVMWGLPAMVPPSVRSMPNDLAKYLGTDLDEALERLLAEERGI